MRVQRRSILAAAAGGIVLPRFAIAQADLRPAIRIAVQKVSNTNTLEVLREQSNVGERIFFTSLWEGLIGRNWQGSLEEVPMLATGWRRLDDRTVELSLRKGVKFHNGDEMTAEDVIFTFGRERMFGDGKDAPQGVTLFTGTTMTGLSGKELPPEVPAIARRISAVGRVTVSLRKSIIVKTPEKRR